jgi:acetyl-CoA carboxylase, biotin carboxylase subunit
MKRLLVANRGEIAVRVIRSARELGIETVAVYSEADRDALHVELADRAVCIGPPQAVRSYLNAEAIVTTAIGAGCDALHPGYGFLSENPAFAALCEEKGVTFVGPPSEVIARMGDKARAREAMRDADVPVIPGSQGSVGSVENAQHVVRDTGYPVALKARSGGGGRGIRLVRGPDGLEPALRAASAEAEATFGDGALYVERYLERVRHIEVQVLADSLGSVVHLGERDCSLQRRHQKVLEEAPSPVLTRAARERLGELAVQAATAVGYIGAGTVEFLYDPDSRDFFFIEMNTRLQVEHPVTEMLTGIDLVASQLRVATGERLDVTQDAIALRGHAIECRINAEDPERDFAPSPGRISDFAIPAGGPGVRVDTYCAAGSVVPPHYDSMIAKVITHGWEREEALRRMRRVLQESEIRGVPTTIPLHLRLLDDPRFAAGDVSTTFLQELERA